MINLANKILDDLPGLYDVKAAEKEYPVSYEQSMNTVLTQELERFNILLKTITVTLKDMKRAISGEILMSEEMEEAMIFMLDGKIPGLFLKTSFPSLKPLGSYIIDLKDRLAFFEKWVEEGIPAVYWINLFFFTHGFLTGAMQNFARKYSIAIDTLVYDFEVIFDVPDDGEGVVAPEDGIHVVGMKLEGCKWDAKNRVLGESDPKVLFTACPLIWFKPCRLMDRGKELSYECPLYKTSERKGVLMTTGHSTNYVADIKLPSAVDPGHWIKRGVALLCALSE